MTRTERPLKLAAAFVLAMLWGLALTGAAFRSALVDQQQADAREDDRVAADIASCERGNLARENIRKMGEANEALIRDILDSVFSGAQDKDAAAALLATLEPLFTDYEKVVAEFQPVDCQALVPGGTG